MHKKYSNAQTSGMFRKIILIAMIAVILAAIFLITMSFSDEHAHSRVRRFLFYPDFSLSCSADEHPSDFGYTLAPRLQTHDLHAD